MAIRLRVAGVTLSLRSRYPSPRLSLPRGLRDFAAASGGDIRLEVVEGPVPAPPPASLLFDSGGLWRVHRHPRGLLYVCQEPRRGAPTYEAMLIDRRRRRGWLFSPRPRSGEPRRPLISYPLDELLFQHHLALRGGMEVHACGIVVDGRALLFCGASGAGKTTLARLWKREHPHALVLSDDRIVLRERRGRHWAYGTPWHGSGRFASPAGRPLGAVFFLVQSRRTAPRPVGRVEAAARLFARSFPPPWERRAVGRVLAACGAVAAAVPCRVLRFRPDRSAVAAALAAVAAGG